ncbi:MAG TPA: M20 family metallopeptidase [Blastocatellia bacterium]|nr:M20 family metallopeptidase [Blastocatellia bacterium]
MTQETNPTAFLREYFQGRNAKAVELLRWLVEQESMSRVPEATSRIAEMVGAKLAGLGATVELQRDPKFGATLLAHFGQIPGPGLKPDTPLSSAKTHPAPDEPANKQLLIVGHLDTVWPIGTLAERPFRIEGGLAYGPGAFDMKAGLTIAILAIAALRDLGRSTRRPITFLFTCDEETGSSFSRDTIETQGRCSEAALVLEPPIPGGKVKTRRKGVGEFQIVIRGRPAHAGNDPRAGVSAITELAHQILAINKMSDFEQGTTLNVGVVSGGVLANVIAGQARAVVDLRYRTVEEGARIVEAIYGLKPVLDDACLEVTGGMGRSPLLRTDGVARLFEQARTIASSAGVDLQEGSVGGGSDGNFLAALGIPVLDGLGVDGAGAHAEHEHVIIGDIPLRAALLARLMETI